MLNSLKNCRFSLIFTTLLVHTTTTTISTKNPFLYVAAIFHLSVFAYNHPSYQHPKYFPYLIDLANSDCVKGQRSYGVLISPLWYQGSQLLIPYYSGLENWCIAGSSLWWRCLLANYSIHLSSYLQSIVITSIH